MRDSKALYINLSKGIFSEREIPKEVRDRFIGGRGLGAFLFKENMEDEPIVIATGPLNATPFPMTGRVSLSGRSPLSGTIFDSNAGGSFGTFLKRTGYDALVIKGRSSEPIYLYISDKEVRLEKASELWGLDTLSTTIKLKEFHGNKVSVISIGPAGERGVRFANVMEDGRRAFGRGGAGALFGERGVKAIVVSGEGKTEAFDREKVSNAIYEINKLINTHPLTSQLLPNLGTAGMMRVINSFETLGTKNFQKRSFSRADKIGGEELKRRFLKRKRGCLNCPISCERVCELEGREITGPEFETLWALGANLMIDDLPFIIALNEKANLLGVDTISLGSVLAFAMELKEKGIEDFGVSFGEKRGIMELVEDIALRRGKGSTLSLGVKEASSMVGGEEFALHVKGLEIPAYDPRGAFGMGLGYATSNRGACHLRGGFSVSFEIYGVPRRVNRLSFTGKGAHVAKAQDAGAVADSLIICRFALLSTSLHHWARALSAITGEDWTASDLEKAGERIFNLERLINQRYGFSSKDDTLPERFRREIPLDEMLKEYYEYREWSEDGIPKRDKIAELFGDDLRWPIGRDIIREFKKIGWAMYVAGLQNSHSGNLSVRVGKRMIITRRGSMLGFLTAGDLVELKIDEDDGMMAIASTEFSIHREIYRRTEALAIAHAHLICATALSLLYDEIIPVDVEGAYHIKRVPVLSFEFASGSKEMAETIPQYLRDYHVVMVRGHGAFSVGDTLEEAFYYCSALENSAKIAMAIIGAGEDIKKFQPERLKKW